MRKNCVRIWDHYCQDEKFVNCHDEHSANGSSAKKHEASDQRGHGSNISQGDVAFPRNHDQFVNRSDHSHLLVAGYGQFSSQCMREGWHGYLVTIMFKPLSGSPKIRRDGMMREIEHLYSKLSTRAARWPRSPKWIPHLPKGMFALDRPRRTKVRLGVANVSPNDGEHWHGILWLSPKSREKVLPLDKHFERRSGLYAPKGGGIRTIHVVPITDRPEYVTQYALKAVEDGLVSFDDILILPKSVSEL
jgi:hypothetical protein